MCLILFAYRCHPDYPLVVAANRDEFHTRATAAAHSWPDQPGILAGRDLEAGGTWLGLHESGKFAALTNIRNPEEQGLNWPRSRGEIVSNYLQSSAKAQEYVSSLQDDLHNYAGFNLLLSDNSRSFHYFSGRTGELRELKAGIYGLSNGDLDTPWPKVVSGKAALSAQLESGPTIEGLLSILTNRSIAADAHLPETGVGLETERLLSPLFIESQQYGTRCSTVVLRKADGGITLVETSFDASGKVSGSISHTWA